MSYQDQDFDNAPKWLIRLIHAVIIGGGILLVATFFYALRQLP